MDRNKNREDNMFDKLLLSEAIDIPEWEAANLLVEDLKAGGTECPAFDDITIMKTTPDNIALRSIYSDLGTRAANFIHFIATHPVTEIPEESLEDFSSLVAQNLKPLVKHYGTTGKVDPRRLVKRGFSSR